MATPRSVWGPAVKVDGRDSNVKSPGSGGHGSNVKSSGTTAHPRNVRHKKSRHVGRHHKRSSKR